MTTRYPEREHWFCASGDPAVLGEMKAGALRAIDRTGKRQVIHLHSADEKCDGDTACWVIERTPKPREAAR